MKTFKEFTNICDEYVPLRTSDQPYDDEGWHTRTPRWNKKMGDALMNVGKQKFRSRMNIGNSINNLVRGVSAAARLAAMKKVDAEPESVRAKRSQAKSAANKRLGAQRRTLQTQLDRQKLNKQWRGGGGGFSSPETLTYDQPDSFDPSRYGGV